MFKNMANSVIIHEQVVTTVEKAKEVRRTVDRLITLAKKGSDASRRLAFDRTRDNQVVKKLFDVLAPRYKTRAGGYTRVLKLVDRRWGDAAEMAVLELVDRAEFNRGKKTKGQKAEVSNKADAPVAGQDPLSKVRKAFAGKSRATAAANVKAAKPVKAKAAKAASSARKVPSGGKQGGSSSG